MHMLKLVFCLSHSVRSYPPWVKLWADCDFICISSGEGRSSSLHHGFPVFVHLFSSLLQSRTFHVHLLFVLFHVSSVLLSWLKPKFPAICAHLTASHISNLEYRFKGQFESVAGIESVTVNRNALWHFAEGIQPVIGVPWWLCQFRDSGIQRKGRWWTASFGSKTWICGSTIN